MEEFLQGSFTSNQRRETHSSLDSSFSLKFVLVLFSLSSNSTLAREDNDDDDGDRDRDVNDDDNDDDNGVDDDSGEYVFAKLPSPCTMG